MRPLLFLDVDGVLNGDSRRHSLHHALELAAEHVPRSPFNRVPDGPTMKLDVALDPRYAAWLKELSLHFDLVWATTWQDAANTYLAPLLDLPPLPVVRHSETPARFSEVKAGQVAQWKWRSILDFAKSRPFAFVDDQATGLRRNPAPTPVQPFLVLAPRYGLTRSDVDALLTFAASLDPTPSSGLDLSN